MTIMSIGGGFYGTVFLFVCGVCMCFLYFRCKTQEAGDRRQETRGKVGVFNFILLSRYMLL